MKDSQIALNPNPIVRFLGVVPEEFTKKGLTRFIEENNIGMVNLRYVGGDGRLKTLNFVINSKSQLDQLLSQGERVDGSSLFSYIDSASSDLYVVPRYQTAFVNPFTPIPTIDFVCSYYSSDGQPLANAPENVLHKAHDSLKQATGMTLEAMGELEYYVFYERNAAYPVSAQRGYQESSPFTKWEELRHEAMQAIATAGGKIKYGHSEVGCIAGEENDVEQHEIEFLPVPVEEAALQLVLAKWMLRMIGRKYGVTITYAPKILVGHAGSGLHIHARLMKDGQNMLVKGNLLSDVAKRAIAGTLDLAPSMTAFGNTVPTSYLRLVPHQEAPTNICWGDRNRSVLIRVPLGWLGVSEMIRHANPQEKQAVSSSASRQTVEFRCPDGSANIYLLLAGLTVAARHGLQMEHALELADQLYVDVNVFSSEHKDVQSRLPQLPTSCWESADRLLEQRAVYEQDDVFPNGMLDDVVRMLKHYDDQGLSERFYGRGDDIKKLVDEYLHYA
jgi:glutamine synthetase